MTTDDRENQIQITLTQTGLIKMWVDRAEYEEACDYMDGGDSEPMHDLIRHAARNMEMDLAVSGPDANYQIS